MVKEESTKKMSSLMKGAVVVAPMAACAVAMFVKNQ